MKPLNPEEITALLADPVPVYVLKETASTNLYAKQLLEDGTEAPFLVLAEKQTAGRGRGTHTFFSPESGLYFTLVIRPDDAADITAVTIAAAAALYEAVEMTAGIRCDIKWINDLYLNGRKTAGILCEAPWRSDGTLRGIIIGIGVNVAQKEFPEEIRETAGSLGAPDLDRNRLAACLADRIMHWCSVQDRTELMDLYRSRSFVLGKTVSFVRDGRTVTGKAVTVDDRGSLIVEADRIYELDSGEVSLKSWQ